MRKIALALVVAGAFSMGVALFANEQPGIFIAEHDPPGQFVFDNTDMVNAPPVYEFDQIILASSIDDRGFHNREFLAKEILTVDTVLLVYTDASPPGHDLGDEFVSMTDIETSAASGNRIFVDYSFNTVAAVTHPPGPQEKGGQADAESIVLARTGNIASQYTGLNSVIWGYPSGYL